VTAWWSQHSPPCCDRLGWGEESVTVEATGAIDTSSAASQLINERAIANSTALWP
jgi:hypothetical protein